LLDRQRQSLFRIEIEDTVGIIEGMTNGLVQINLSSVRDGSITSPVPILLLLARS
jgi:hypothetical protein